MNLLAWPALILLAGAGVLVLLAAWRTGPRRREVGTLMIWQRIAEQTRAQKQRRRKLDWLLWLLLAVVGVSAIGAARPAWFMPGERPVVAVYVERGYADISELQERAEAEAGEAELEYYSTRPWTGTVRMLNPGGIESELAQFHARAEDADAWLYFLNQPADSTRGRALPLVTSPFPGDVFEIASEGDELVVRHSAGDRLVVEGAEVLSEMSRGRVTTLRARPVENEVRIVVPEWEVYVLRRRPFVVGVGEDWTTNAHTALFNALGSDKAAGTEPQVWVGSNERMPAIRISQGEAVDMSQHELSFDPQHPVFAELPLSSFDWRAMGRLMPRDPATRPLLSAVHDGRVVGDVIRSRRGSLEFAGDPFSDAPIASAALLLDNAIGVVTGEQPSRRRAYEPEGEFDLPTDRAATPEPFAPYGELEFGTVQEEEPVEFSTWLLLAGGVLLIAAAVLVVRRE